MVDDVKIKVGVDASSAKKEVSLLKRDVSTLIPGFGAIAKVGTVAFAALAAGALKSLQAFLQLKA